MRFLLLVACLSAVGSGAEPAQSSRRGVALLASAALPGSGEMLLGTARRGEAFMWTDGLAWALLGGFSWYSGAREHRARLFAVREAGADRDLSSSAYFNALERYATADQYNEDVRRDARSRYPDDPAAQHAYYEANGYFGDSAWAWGSDSARLHFWDMRRSARSAALRAQFITGVLVLDRLASLIDCAFFCRQPAVLHKVELRPAADGAGLELCYHF